MSAGIGAHFHSTISDHYRPLMHRRTRYSEFIDAIKLLLEIGHLSTDESLVLGCRDAL